MRILLVALFLLITSCQPVDQAKKALDDAERFAQQGEYEKALERHVWFHENALKIKPSYYGVRLSFALSYWVELGKKYPKAMETLKSIRDQKTSRLIAGEHNRELFHDVESINDHIAEMDATVELFEYLDRTNPQFAESIYDIADKSLFKSERYSLARKYLGNPKERFDIAKRNYQSGLEFSKNIVNDAPTRAVFERIFTDEVIRIVTILDKSNERESALKIRDEALKIFDSPEIKNVFKKENTER